MFYLRHFGPVEGRDGDGLAEEMGWACRTGISRVNSVFRVHFLHCYITSTTFNNWIVYYILKYLSSI